MEVSANDLCGLKCRANSARDRGQLVEVGPDLLEAIVDLAFRELQKSKPLKSSLSQGE